METHARNGQNVVFDEKTKVKQTFDYSTVFFFEL